MSTQVDFYITKTADINAVLALVCKLSQKAFLNDYQIMIQTQDTQQSQSLDELLWTFSDDAFIPHQIIPDEDNSRSLIENEVGICAKIEAQDTQRQKQILINLNPNTDIELHTHFERVIEVIWDQDTVKTQGRKRFKHYKELDITPNTHNLD